MSRSRHYPALDGLRGLAILLVLVYHFSYLVPPASLAEHLTARILGVGWSGVDLFFVLSGFLITGILYDARASTSYYRVFYARRVLRIFPLYYLFVGGYIALWLPWVFRGHPAIDTLSSHQLWFWTFTSNILITMHGTPDMAPFFTAAMWSLAVEEQFYAVWPWVVRISGSHLARLCLVVAAGACVFRIALAWTPWWYGAQMLMPARMDTLAIGAWLAVVAREQPARIRTLQQWGAPAGLVLLAVWSVAGLHLDTAFVRMIGFSIIALFFGGALAACLADPSSVWTTLGHNRVLQWFGKYSFGIYVFHNIVRMALELTGLDGPSLAAGGWPWIAAVSFYALLGIGLSTLCAMVSWELLEGPINNLKRYVPYQSEAPPATLPRAESVVAP